MNELSHIAYTFNDVLIKPKYSEVESRTKVNVGTKIGKLNLSLPIVSSNMKTVTEAKMAGTISKYGGLGVLHRFCTIEDNVQMFKDSFEYINVLTERCAANIGVSVGVNDADKERFDKLYEVGARTFAIDVAHGHHILVKNMLNWINSNYNTNREELTLIAGNIATREGYKDLIQWGADVAKVGLGSSPICRTRYNTGVGVPQLYALEEIYNASLEEKLPIGIIADGGLSSSGDIAKALKYADACMIGSLLSGTSETSGNVFKSENGEYYKVYGGSASGENKGENKFVEGITKTVKFKGKVKYILKEIEDGIRSAFSYVGANNIEEFHDKCEFVYISSGSQKESVI